jgi:hypothetical protein
MLPVSKRFFPRVSPLRSKRSFARAGVAVFALLGAVLPVLPAHAVHLWWDKQGPEDTSLPQINNFAPTGELANSGWQHVGFHRIHQTGWAVAPNWFLLAKHVADVPDVLDWNFEYDGKSYDVVEMVKHPTADLSLLRVDGVFDKIIPMYTRSDEVGQQIMIVGNGFAYINPDAPIITEEGNKAGYFWKFEQNQLTWATNRVEDVPQDKRAGSEADYLYFTYDAPTINGNPNPRSTGANEGMTGPGDSSSGVFIKDGDTWKLAGVLSGVDGFYDRDGNMIDANGNLQTDIFWGAIDDARGLWIPTFDEATGAYTGPFKITGDEPVPTGGYAMRMSSYQGWISSVTGQNIVSAPEPSSAGLLTLILGGGVLAARLRRKG